MTKENQTVWLDKAGRELLVQKSDGEWYVPLSTVKLETLIELGAAVSDAVQYAKAPGTEAK